MEKQILTRLDLKTVIKTLKEKAKEGQNNEEVMKNS